MRKTFYYCEGCRLFREDEKEGLCKHAEICLTARAQIVKTARKTIEPVDPEGRYQRLIEELRAEEAPDNVFDMLEQWASALEDLMILVDERTAALEAIVQCSEGPLEAISRMLQKRSPWIRAAEGKPEMTEQVEGDNFMTDYSEDVLIYQCGDPRFTKNIQIGRYSKKSYYGEGFTDEYFDPINDVTHWMPLPEPPEE